MRVAVIIPTYNRPQLLGRAIKSAINQSKKAFEIIVVNDSPTVPVAIGYGAKVIETTGGIGCGACRRLAVSRLSPKVEAVCYLDDDDELFPNHIELLSGALGGETQFAFSKAIYKHNDGSETEDPEPSNKNPNKRYYDPMALLEQNIAPVSSFIHTIKAYNDIGGWDTSLPRVEDWDFWGRMFIQFGPPRFINQVTNRIYKDSGNNMTDSNRFVYSMMCSWRDIVSDRLKYLAGRERGWLIDDDLRKFHVPRVGVVMPVFNAEKHLDEAMDSVLSQSYEDFEVIAVDDASTDGSSDMLSKFSQKDKRVRVFRLEKNVGVARALNYGLLLSRSEYVARMDADDVSMPHRFGMQVHHLDRNKDIGVVGSYFLSMDEGLKNIIWDNRDIPTRPEEVRSELIRRCCIGHPTTMFRRKVIESIGGYSEEERHKHVEDYEFWLRVSKKFGIANIPEYLLKYRQYDKQVSFLNSAIQKVNYEKLCNRP